METEDHYHRFVQWSDEDLCYIGYCPDLYFGGVCHAHEALGAYSKLQTIIREEVAHRLAQGQTLPIPGSKATRDGQTTLSQKPFAFIKPSGYQRETP